MVDSVQGAGLINKALSMPSLSQKATETAAESAPTGPAAAPFKSYVEGWVHQAKAQALSVEQMSVAQAAGKSGDISQLTTAVKQLELTLDIAKGIQSAIISGWQELHKMQI